MVKPRKLAKKPAQTLEQRRSDERASGWPVRA